MVWFLTSYYNLDESKNVNMEDLEGVDFDMKDNTNMTPLHMAALCRWTHYQEGNFESSWNIVVSNSELAKFLIGLKKENNEHRVDIDAQDDHQFTPLMYAITTRNTRIIKLLLENNADVHHLQNENGDTAHDMVEKMDDTPEISLLFE